MNNIRIFAAVILAFSLASCSLPKTKVDLLLTNGHFYTMDPRIPDAEAVAVSGGKIVAVGMSRWITSRYEGKKTLDLRNAFVLPGLIDGHAHMVGLGMSFTTVNLTSARTVDDVVKLVQSAASKIVPGGWIRGTGWNERLLRQINSSPAAVLDKAVPGFYVFLVSSGGQAVWVNTKVMELAGVTASTISPAGGLIIRGKNREPSGIFVGAAINLVASQIPPPSELELQNAITLAADTCARYGITEVQDAGIDTGVLHAYQGLASKGGLKIRIYAMYNGNDTTLPAILKQGPILGEKGYFTMRAVRVDMDGPLSNRSAALVSAYSDDPGNYGETYLGEKDLENLTVASLASGFQVCTEAHGDRGIDVVLDAYQKALKAAGISDPRLRVEGVDVLLPGDIRRFKELGIIPSMQPVQCVSNMYWVESRVGRSRVRRTYAWQSLLKTGSIIVGGSDFPDDSPDPRMGIYTAVTRQDIDGVPQTFGEAEKYFSLTPDAAEDSSDFNGGFVPEQRMTINEAIKSFTIWPAYGAFQEKEKGTISVGKYADFTIFEKDFVDGPVDKIPYDTILGTIVGGKFVYVDTSAANWRIR
ncbi:MAG: amidohydrolase [Bacteroidetes bacterium]|nr:amidohydrolase [Bacteroidota bacterium]